MFGKAAVAEVGASQVVPHGVQVVVEILMHIKQMEQTVHSVVRSQISLKFSCLYGK